jgi:hypothetical protein
MRPKIVDEMSGLQTTMSHYQTSSSRTGWMIAAGGTIGFVVWVAVATGGRPVHIAVAVGMGLLTWHLLRSGFRVTSEESVSRVLSASVT